MNSICKSFNMKLKLKWSNLIWLKLGCKNCMIVFVIVSFDPMRLVHPPVIALRRADLMRSVRIPKIWGSEKRETNLQLHHHRTIFHMSSKPEAATQKYSMESGALKILWRMCL